MFKKIDDLLKTLKQAKDSLAKGDIIPFKRKPVDKPRAADKKTRMHIEPSKKPAYQDPDHQAEVIKLPPKPPGWMKKVDGKSYSPAPASQGRSGSVNMAMNEDGIEKAEGKPKAYSGGKKPAQRNKGARRITPTKVTPKRTMPKRITPKKVQPAARGIVNFYKNGQWAIEKMEKYGDAITIGNAEGLTRAENEGQLYHLHDSGMRITDKPMSIKAIENRWGSVKRVEDSGIKMVPHKAQAVSWIPKARSDNAKKSNAVGDSQYQPVVPERYDFGANDQWDPKEKEVKKKEYIKGGMADGKGDANFDSKQIDMGMRIEMEHTNNQDIAREIARDHLVEDPKYYTRLKEMEAKSKTRKK